MTSFIVVHNIPSPYRLHLFTVLSQRLQARGIGFHVHFMAAQHDDRRHWRMDSGRIPFSHSFWRDIGPALGGMRWHLNPGLIVSLARQPSEYLMVGGLWDSLTNLLLSVSARRKVGIAWLEGNTKATGRITGVIGGLKRSLLRRFQFAAVPGKEGRQYAELILAQRGPAPTIVCLPNIVDEALFMPAWELSASRRAELRGSLGVHENEMLAIWPARLVPAKGVLEFLARLAPADLAGWKILILGQGPLEDQVQQTITARCLEPHVILKRYVSYDQMPEAYAASDLFLLPSVVDPNPLSVVEAMHSGLPLLVSNRIGNFPEALREGVNGWGLDPFDTPSVKAAVAAALSSSPDELREMGRRSRAIAAGFWGSVKAVDAFLDRVCILP